MIVLDGSPGAGKTTLVGQMLEAAPDRLVAFPEAQPPGNITADAAVARRLLAEDLARTRAATRLTAAQPDRLVVSDRCHLGVLAYRHALWRTGQAPRGNLDRAVELCRTMQIEQAHRDDTIVVLLIDPHESIRRRAAFAHDHRYRTWYDLDFLTAYNQAMVELADTFTTGATVIVHDVTRTTGPPPPLAHLTAEPQRPTPTPRLTCHRGCPQPRSNPVTTPAGRIQLYASSLHLQRPDKVACLHSADDIEATFTTRPQHCSAATADCAR